MKDHYDFSKGVRGKYSEKTCILVERSNVDLACEFLNLNRIDYQFERSFTNDEMKFIFAKQFEKAFLEAVYK